MPVEMVATPEAPRAIGPYSQAIRAGGLLFTAGQVGFDPATGTVTDEYRRSVMYLPFATAESTGLSTSASAVDPWIMFPGTAGAHIMITPPRKKSGG